MSITVALFAAVLAVHAPQDTQSADVRFRWAFGALTGSTGARQLVRITDDITLHSGDQLKMLLAPVTTCFVYVLRESPAGELSVLFPSPTGALPADYRAGASYSIPAGSDWLELGAKTGIERIYLIASAARLTRLETLLQNKSPSKEVVGELAALRRQYAKVDWAERPISIGGQVRGKKQPAPSIAPFTAEIAAKAFFSRVYIIDHR